VKVQHSGNQFGFKDRFDQSARQGERLAMRLDELSASGKGRSLNGFDDNAEMPRAPTKEFAQVVAGDVLDHFAAGLIRRPSARTTLRPMR
jgi:hypothetical protein